MPASLKSETESENSNICYCYLMLKFKIVFFNKVLLPLYSLHESLCKNQFQNFFHAFFFLSVLLVRYSGECLAMHVSKK